MSDVVPIFRDPCEYNPQEKRAAYNNEVHAEATTIAGSNGKWRLCDECAALPEFASLKKRLIRTLKGTP